VFGAQNSAETGSIWHYFSYHWQQGLDKLMKNHLYWRSPMFANPDTLFLLMLSFFLCHELDAIRHHEWRLFAFINRLEDDAAYAVFTFLHIPLFGFLLWFVANPAIWFFIAADSFAIIHLGLHGWFRTDPRYEFQGFASNLFIIGTALAGAAHLLVFLATS
jgi:hypothetical protein